MKDAAPKPKPYSKNEKWIKLARILIYAVSIIGTLVGASLIKTGGLSASYADGTYVAKIHNGEVLFYVFLPILCGNIFWGILRWFLRGYKEQWKAGAIIAKLIGGGLWRTFAIIPLIIISIFFIAPAVSRTITNHVAESSKSVEKNIFSEPEKDLENIANHLSEYADIEKLQEDMAPFLFSNIDFDINADNNTTNDTSWFPLSQNAYAYSSNVKTLNKAKMSKSKHFVVFYTDTGDDKISDDKAAELASMLEDIIERYESKLGLKYKYEKFSTSESSMKKVKKVLENSGISQDALDSAMPVYVVNPYKKGSRTLASYAGRRFYNLTTLISIGAFFGEETAKLYNSTPSYPFINILPSNISSDSLPVVTAHELGHHYIQNYSFDHYGKEGSDDDFIDETTPNWMAINVFPSRTKNDLINSDHYNGTYLSDSTSETISSAGDSSGLVGYTAVAFLENYHDIVPGSKQIILNATHSGDALNYLSSHAGSDNFKKVMTTLAEKNLTGNYGGKLVNYTLPKGERLSCVDFCTAEYEISPAATEYLYFATGEYRDINIEFVGDPTVSVSVLGKNLGGNWQVITSGSNEASLDITEELAGQYEVIAFAVANYSISGANKYTIKINQMELAQAITDEGGYDFSDFYSELGNGCIRVDLDTLLDNATQAIDLGSELIGAFADLSASFEGDPAGISEIKADYDSKAAATKAKLNEDRAELAPYEITICGNYIAGSNSFDAIKAKLQSALKGSLNLINEEEGSDKISVFVGVDLLARRGKLYILGQSGSDMGLVTVDVVEK